MTGSVTGIRRRRGVAGRRETPHLPLDRDFYGQTLIKDETAVIGSGFIDGVKILSSKRKGDQSVVRVGAAILPYREVVNSSGSRKVSAKARGDDILRLIADARRDAIFACGSGCSFSEVYNSGTLARITMEKAISGWFGGFSAKVAGGQGAENVVTIEGEMSDVKNDAGHDAVIVRGYGRTLSDFQSVDLARFDAMLGFGGKVRAYSRFERGERAEDRLDVTTRAFVKVSSRDVDDGLMSVEAVVGKDAEAVLNRDENGGVRVAALGQTLFEALAKAKYDAIMDGGLEIDAKLRYSNGVLNGCEARGSATGALKAFEISENNAGRVSVSAIVCGSGDERLNEKVTTRGYGLGADEESSFVLARCDAILNAHSVVEKEMTFSLGEKPSGRIKQTAQGFVGPAINRKDVAGGGLMLEVDAADSAETVLKSGNFKSGGSGVGKTSADAFAAARFNAIYNAGMALDVTSNYADGNLVGCAATGVCALDLRGCDEAWVRADGDIYRATVKMNLSVPGDNRRGANKSVGFGVARNIKTARGLARADAVLNAKSAMTQNYRYENGVCVDSSSSIKGECVFFDEELELTHENGCCVAKVNARLGNAYQELPEGNGRTVKARGYGATKELAVEDAKRNAIDKVFGRRIKVETSNAKIGGSAYDVSENAFADGYVVKADVKDSFEGEEGWRVDMEAVVQQRGKEEDHGIFWYIWQGICWVVCGIFKLLWWVIKAIWTVVCWIFGLIF